MEISSLIRTSVSIVYNNLQAVQTQNKYLHNILFWVPQAQIICQVLKFISLFQIYEAFVNPEGSHILKYLSYL